MSEYVAIFFGTLILVVAVLLGILSVTKKAAFAVLKRNFLGYFSNPTGYVFLLHFRVADFDGRLLAA